MRIQHIFIIGAKSIGQYGGYETFVNKLSEYHQNAGEIKYHIACKANGDGHMDESLLDGVEVIERDAEGKVFEFTYHNAHVFKLKVPDIGSAVAVYYDLQALKYSIEYCRKHNISCPAIYILACRIGPFIRHYKRQIRKLEGTLYLNPDGHEFLRGKWHPIIRKYWKLSEKLMVSYADLVVCDSINIERYIQNEYDIPDSKTAFIAYGSDTAASILEDDDPKFMEWLASQRLKKDGYYLVVGRFVPENNYETIIREFMESKSSRSLVLITNAGGKYMDQLSRTLHFQNDNRIHFAGTVYDPELLKKIRENAYGYFHGHEVGGTNPSLLEALGSTQLNLLLDVGFNREVGAENALYWNKDSGNLASLIDQADRMTADERICYGMKAKARIQTAYSWQLIADAYRKLWMKQEGCG